MVLCLGLPAQCWRKCPDRTMGECQQTLVDTSGDAITGVRLIRRVRRGAVTEPAMLLSPLIQPTHLASLLHLVIITNINGTENQPWVVVVGLLGSVRERAVRAVQEISSSRRAANASANVVSQPRFLRALRAPARCDGAAGSRNLTERRSPQAPDIDAARPAGETAAMPAPAPTPRLTTQAWALIIALSIPWGGSFIFYRVLAAELPAFTIVLARVALAAPVLYALLRLRGQRLDIPWGAFLVMGVLNNVIPFTLFAWAETRVTGGVAAVLNAFTPIATAIVLHAAGAERLTPARAAGVALGFAGVGVLVGPDLGTLGRDLVANLACLAATVSYAFSALWGRRLRHVPALQAATGQIVCSTLVLIPLAVLVDRPWTLPAPSPVTWLNLLGLAWISTAVAYVIFFRILAVAGAANLMLVTFLIPVSALVLGTVFLGETITPQALVGMGLIAAALAAIDGRVLRRDRAAT
jgi:drug/metabolite transporter (DMT)-like permease